MTPSIDDELRGRRVDALKGGVRLTLELSGGLIVTVANDFRLQSAGEVDHFYPGLGLEPRGRLAGLLGARIQAARVGQAGTLELAFDHGRTLYALPDITGPEEAWQISGPDGPLFTAQPGGYH